MKKKVDIVMRLRILRNVFKQGFQGMWRNRGMGLASVGSITAVLIMLGLVLIMVLSAQNALVETRAQFNELQVHLEDDLDMEVEDNIKTTLEKLSGVEKVSYYTKEEALEEMKEDWEENASILDDVDENNPLNNSYIVTLNNPDEAKNITKIATDLDGVEKVTSFQDLIEKLITFSSSVQKIGITIIIILVLVSVFIISNTIKITVTARGREISIMKYVGGTNGYIRGPFVIEGVLFGLIGSLLSILVIKYGYQSFFNLLSGDSLKMISDYLIAPEKLIKDLSLVFLSIGNGYRCSRKLGIYKKIFKCLVGGIRI